VSTAQTVGGGVRLEALDRRHLDRVVAIEALTSPRPWSDASFLEELDRADRRYLVALAPDVVGFAGLALQAGDAHVMTVAVHPDAQRLGVGRRLVRGLLAAASEAGAAAATLEVRTSNTPAVRLYRSAGFEAAGVRPGYYPDGEDAMIMWCHGLARVDPPDHGS
jgi:[ribosomal protein S18]-alanine N-acetyltransferase